MVLHGPASLPEAGIAAHGGLQLIPGPRLFGEVGSGASLGLHPYPSRPRSSPALPGLGLEPSLSLHHLG